MDIQTKATTGMSIVIGSLVLMSASLSFSAWVNVSTGLPNNLVVLGAMPKHDKIIAFSASDDFNGATIQATTDGGATWTALGTGAGSEHVANRTIGVLFDPQYPDTFWEWGNYAGATGLYKSTDGGTTFHNIDQIYEGDGVSVDFSDPKRRTMLLGIHERKDSLLLSTNGGVSWHNIGNTLPTTSAFSEYPLILDSGTFLIGCSFADHGSWDIGGTAGIYRTTNAGQTWTPVSALTVFQAPLVVNDTIYWSSYNGSTGGIIRSVDKGLTWTTVTASGMTYTTMPFSLPNHTIATLSTSKTIYTSANGSAPWTSLSTAATLTTPFGLVYDEVRGSFFAWQVNGGVVRFDLVVSANDKFRTRSNLTRNNSPVIVEDIAGLSAGTALFDLTGRYVRKTANVHDLTGSRLRLFIAVPPDRQ